MFNSIVVGARLAVVVMFVLGIVLFPVSPLLSTIWMLLSGTLTIEWLIVNALLQWVFYAMFIHGFVVRVNKSPR